jgi:lactoylglutathione lyase
MTSIYVTTRLLVRDYAASLRFYRDTLGLAVAQTIGEGDGVYCEVGAEGGRIALYSREMFATSVIALSPPARGDAMLIALQVQDVAAVAAELEGHGVKLEVGVTERPEWALKTVHLRDPDDNVIELFERI